MKEEKNKENKLKFNSVYEKLAYVQNKLIAPKGQYNKFGNYKYRSCEDILESIKKLQSDVGFIVCLRDDIESIDGRFYIKSTAMFSCSETREMLYATAYAREAETKKGMDEAQITGAASSYARKYALNALFAIDDTKDPDSTNKHGKDTEENKKPDIKNNIKERIEKGFVSLKIEEKVKKYLLKKYKQEDLLEALFNLARNEIKLESLLGEDYENS